MASSMDDSDDEFDPIVPPDNELDKVQKYISAWLYWSMFVVSFSFCCVSLPYLSLPVNEILFFNRHISTTRR